MISILVERAKAAINARDKLRRTPLLRAVAAGKLTSVKLLISLGANAGAEDNEGNDALHNAVLSQERPTFEWLLAQRGELKLDPFDKNKEGKTCADLMGGDDVLKNLMEKVDFEKQKESGD